MQHDRVQLNTYRDAFPGRPEETAEDFPFGSRRTATNRVGPRDRVRKRDTAASRKFQKKLLNLKKPQLERNVLFFDESKKKKK